MSVRNETQKEAIMEFDDQDMFDVFDASASTAPKKGDKDRKVCVSCGVVYVWLKLNVEANPINHLCSFSEQKESCLVG